MTELFDLLAVWKRTRSEPAELTAIIATFGGDILESRCVARLVHSPFKTRRIFPLLYEFRTNHGKRRGYWYVRTSGDSAAYDWAWCDLEGYDTLPVDGINGHIANEITAVGWVKDWLIVGTMIVTGVLVCVVFAWFIL